MRIKRWRTAQKAEREAYLNFASVDSVLNPIQKAPERLTGSFGCNGTPGRIRTCDLRIRSPLLYPTELLALGLNHQYKNRISWAYQGNPEAFLPTRRLVQAGIRLLCLTLNDC